MDHSLTCHPKEDSLHGVADSPTGISITPRMLVVSANQVSSKAMARCATSAIGSVRDHCRLLQALAHRCVMAVDCVTRVIHAKEEEARQDGARVGRVVKVSQMPDRGHHGESSSLDLPSSVFQLPRKRTRNGAQKCVLIHLPPPHPMSQHRRLLRKMRQRSDRG